MFIDYAPFGERILIFNCLFFRVTADSSCLKDALFSYQPEEPARNRRGGDDEADDRCRAEAREHVPEEALMARDIDEGELAPRIEVHVDFIYVYGQFNNQLSPSDFSMSPEVGLGLTF